MQKGMFLALGLLLASPITWAQTCASPSDTFTDASQIGNGDTCASATDEFANVCGFLFAGGKSEVWQVQVGAANNFTITVTPAAGYDTGIYLVGPGACSPATGCADDADDNGDGVAETLTLNGIAPDTYYLVVDSTVSAAECGTYTIAFTGTLPVELKNFSITSS